MLHFVDVATCHNINTNISVNDNTTVRTCRLNFYVAMCVCVLRLRILGCQGNSHLTLYSNPSIVATVVYGIHIVLKKWIRNTILDLQPVLYPT